MLVGSLPKTYDTHLSAIMATMNVLGKALDPDALIQCVGDEYDRRAIANGTGKGKSQDVALYAGDKSGRGKKGKKTDLECFNCHKKGHKKADCWAKGGGKEGQGPRSQRGRKPNQQTRRRTRTMTASGTRTSKAMMKATAATRMTCWRTQKTTRKLGDGRMTYPI